MSAKDVADAILRDFRTSMADTAVYTFESEEVPEDAPAQAAPESEPDAPRVAVCANCGEQVELAADARAEDIAFQCCPSPKWQVR